MRSADTPPRRNRRAVGALLAVTLLLLSVAPMLLAAEGRPGPATVRAEITSDAPAAPIAAWLAASDALVPEASAAMPGAGAHLLAGEPPGPVTLQLTLRFTNSSALSGLLAALVDPNSSDYHHFLSAAQFTARFAPNASAYATLLADLGSAGPGQLTAYPDRLAVSFRAPATTVAAAFGASLGWYASGGAEYAAFSSPPSLPAPLAGLLAGIDGLGPDSAVSAVAQMNVEAGVSSGGRSAGVAPADVVYPTPVTVAGVQELYPADLQVAYDEEGLLGQYGYPTNTSVAALLWAGAYGGTGARVCGLTLTTGASVGPYVPSDLAQFFGSTLPPGAPAPTVVAVPIEGSPGPGCAASYDSTGVVAANTAELEMIGSLAPGATIFAVTAPGPSVAGLAAALASVLSPPTNLTAAQREGLANVSVVTVGWGTMDQSSAAWSSDLTQAAARGITIVAGTGNSGDNNRSRAWVGSRAEFPASDATGTSGALGVGGTTVTLDPSTLHIDSEIPWNVSAHDTAGGGPIGTTGGISTAYGEPSFQKSSSANTVLDGDGRGLPDVAAVANNTLVTLTLNGTQYRATNATDGGPFRAAEGTAVAAGVVGGLLAVVDHSLHVEGAPALGYADPTIYTWADEQYTTASGPYPYSLPTTPFRDVKTGANDHYSARAGWDLVTGWGSVDAYNLTMYVLPPPTVAAYGELSGVQDQVRLSSMHVTTTVDGSVNRAYNASLQQNFFVASPTGSPIYWGQSVVYAHKVSSGWAMNFTAWLAFPFWGLYPELTDFVYHFPATGEVESLPLSLTLTTILVPAKGTAPPELKFTFGVPGAPVLTLDAPGGAYIIGRTGYSYAWQGTNYTDGPRVTTSPLGFLAPQFVLVGGPSGGLGTFAAKTAGTVTALTEQLGSSTFAGAEVGLVTENNTQTGESAVNLAFNLSGTDALTFAYDDGAADQGIYQVAEPWFPVAFEQTGGTSSIQWYVNISNGYQLHALGSVAALDTELPNGTYSWSATTSEPSISVLPAAGSLTVSGRAAVVTLAIGSSMGVVTFDAKGPVKAGHLNFTWYVNITGEPAHHQTSTVYTANLTLGSYTYHVASTLKTYRPSKATGTLTITRTVSTIYVTFAPVTYLVDFHIHQPKSPGSLTISLGVVSESGAFTSWGVEETNGSYRWSISHVPLGYAVTPTHGVAVVRGAALAITVTVTEPGWGPLGLGVLGYALVIGAPALAAIWYLVVRARRRRRAGPRAEPVPKPARRPPRPPRPPRARRDLSPDEI